MKDRRFTVMIALVVAAGLVMGLVAFRMTGGSPAGASAGAPVVSNDGQPHPSAADSEVASSDQPTDSVPLSAQDDAKNGEPSTPSKAPPEMQGPANGDPPGTAAQIPVQAPEPALEQSEPAPSLDAAPQ